jgi:hypothetical protein
VIFAFKSEEGVSLCPRWLDKLGLSAQMGIEVVMRQVLFGAGNYHLVDQNFEPLPVSDHHFSNSITRGNLGPLVLT